MVKRSIPNIKSYDGMAGTTNQQQILSYQLGILLDFLIAVQFELPVKAV
ncbi:MAG: hypothetical protein PUP91_34810 [Rhizonema sp. PD37]|nr:hypothetical protein [Rhizonema sp. PD37]